LPVVYAEYLARPTGKDLLFAKVALGAGLEPWWVTYERDGFASTNEKKASMRRPKLAFAKGQQTKGWIVSQEQRQDGDMGSTPTIFSEIETVAEYWRRMRGLVMSRDPKLNGVKGNVFDISEWYWRQAKDASGVNKAPAYYPNLMGLYAGRAALFTSFSPAFRPVAEAGFKAATEKLGVEPIIIKFRPVKTVLSGEGREIKSELTDLTFLTPEHIKSLQENGYVPSEDCDEV
jgi:hypothetical protein